MAGAVLVGASARPKANVGAAAGASAGLAPKTNDDALGASVGGAAALAPEDPKEKMGAVAAAGAAGGSAGLAPKVNGEADVV